MQNWFPVEWSRKISSTKSYRIILNNKPLVLFRSAGTVCALLDKCPHRGAPLSKGFIRNGCLVCPYHGWRFQGNGICNSIPGVAVCSPKKIHQVKAYNTKEKHGLIWIALDTNATDNIPPIVIKSKYKKFEFDLEIHSSLKDIIENALDPLHTHFVHSGWIRTDAKRQFVNVKMKIKQNSIEAEYVDEIKQQGWIHKILTFGSTIEKSFGRFFYPSLFQIEYQTTKRKKLIINGFLSPIDKERSRIFFNIITNTCIPEIFFKAMVKPLFMKAIRQDKEILEIRSKNIEKFEKIKQVSTQGDLFGPYLDLLLAKKNLTPKEYTLKLYV